MELTPRLQLAADFCLPCESVIDVGCDHAYLCLYLVEHGAVKAAASDIRPGPLAAAKEHIAACGRQDRVRFDFQQKRRSSAMSNVSDDMRSKAARC